MNDTPGSALGLVETIGLAAGLEAADTMVKAANVVIETRQQVGGGRVTILVRGEVAAVTAAVEAAAVAAARVGQVVSAHVIPCPRPEVETILRRRWVR